MKPPLLLRITSVLLLVFAAGHTYGALATPSRGLAEAVVFSGMRSFQFDIMGVSRTHWEFYVGFSLFLSVSLFLLAVLVWQIANIATLYPARVWPMVFALFVAHVGFAVLCWVYFFPAPAVVTSVATIFLGWAVLITPFRISRTP